MTLKQEKELLEKIRENKSHFGRLFEEYKNDIYRYIKSFVNSHELAEELTSETFLIALNKVNNFKWQEISLKFWLLQISRNLLYQNYAKNRWITEQLEVNETIESNANTQDLLELQINSEIAEQLRSLPDTTREILTLKIWQEYTFRDIALLIDSSESQVKMEYYRGLEKLRILLKKKGYGKQAAIPAILAALTLQGNSADLTLPTASSELILNKIAASGEAINNFFKLRTMSTGYKLFLSAFGLTSVVGTVVGIYLYSRPTNQVVQDTIKPGTENIVIEKDDETPVSEQTSEDEIVDPDAGRIVYRYEHDSKEYKLLMDNPTNLTHYIREDPFYGQQLIVNIDDKFELIIYERSEESIGGIYPNNTVFIKDTIYRYFYLGYTYGKQYSVCEGGNPPCYGFAFHSAQNGTLGGFIKHADGTPYSQSDVSDSTQKTADELIKSYTIIQR